jgi:hypothetical protein
MSCVRQLLPVRWCAWSTRRSCARPSTCARRQTPGRHSRFERARDRAEQRGLIQAGNIDEVTYLWLTRPAAGDEEEPDVVLPEEVAQHRLAGLSTQEGTDV